MTQRRKEKKEKRRDDAFMANVSRKRKWEGKEQDSKRRSKKINKTVSVPAYDTFKEFKLDLKTTNSAGRKKTDKQKFDAAWLQLYRLKQMFDFKHRTQKDIKVQKAGRGINWKASLKQILAELRLKSRMASSGPIKIGGRSKGRTDCGRSTVWSTTTHQRTRTILEK